MSSFTVTPRSFASVGIMESMPRLSSCPVGPLRRLSSVSCRGESLAGMARMTLFSEIFPFASTLVKNSRALRDVGLSGGLPVASVSG